ncbi:hypothetical protein DFH06DRAFT_1316541 [Mycena polygramma]|nr:hypothetical protein DFH06DRAFT_1316541 [Mycena polygramma]
MHLQSLLFVCAAAAVVSAHVDEPEARGSRNEVDWKRIQVDWKRSASYPPVWKKDTETPSVLKRFEAVAARVQARNDDVLQ